MSSAVRLDRRTLLRSLGLQAGLLLVAACSGPATPTTAQPTSAAARPKTWDEILGAAKQEGQVLMYGAVLVGDDATKLGAAFKQATGISFEYIPLLGGPATTRIRQEIKVGKGPDLFEGSNGWVGTMVPENVYVPLKSQPLPVWSDPESVWFIHPGYKNPDDWQYVLSRLRPRNGHVVVNSKLLAAADYPTSWHDLSTNPKFKGKIGYMDPVANAGNATDWTMMGYVGKNMTPEDFWSLHAAQDTLLYKQGRSQYTGAAQGERLIGVGAADESTLNLLAAGAPMKNLFFPDSVYYALDGDVAVLNSAPHPNAALVFLNWFLSKEGQDAIGQLQQIASLRRDVTNYTPAALRGEVVGGGSKGQLLVQTPQQIMFGADLVQSQILAHLTDDSPLGTYTDAYVAFVQDWQSKHGAQDKPTALPQ